MDKLPTINQEKITTQATYKDLDDWIQNNVIGRNYRDKIHELCRFYQHRDKTNIEAILEQGLKDIQNIIHTNNGRVQP